MKKGFHLSHEADDHFILQHPDGDHLKIAKRGLSSKMMEQIKGFAHGGMAEREEPNPKLEQSHVQNYAYGGISNKNQSTPEDAPMPWEQPVSSEMPQPQMPQQAAPQRGLQQMPAATPEANAQISAPPNALKEYQDILAQQVQATQSAANADAEMAKAQQGALNRQVVERQQALDLFQKHKSDLESRINSTASDVLNGHIDPNQVWNNKNSSQKAFTIIGAILGGGAGNPALQIYQDEVNRDIKAQEAVLGQKKTVLDAYLKEWGDLPSAENALRLDQDSVLAARLMATANQFKNPKVQAAAQAAIAQLRLGMADKTTPLAIQKWKMDMMFGGGGSEADEQRGIAGGKPRNKVDLDTAIDILEPEKGKNEALHKGATKINQSFEDAKLAISAFNQLDTLMAGEIIPSIGNINLGPLGHLNIGKSGNFRNALLDALATKITHQEAGRVNAEEVRAIINMMPLATDPPSTRAKKRVNLFNHFKGSLDSDSDIKGFKGQYRMVHVPSMDDIPEDYIDPKMRALQESGNGEVITSSAYKKAMKDSESK